LALTHFLPDGSYHWRARARSRDSVWGDWSAGQAFSVATYRIAGQIRTRGYPQALDIRADYAYVADGQAGLSIYRIDDPMNLSLIGSIMDTTNSAYGVAAAERYAYLAYGRKQLQIVDIRNLDSLQMLGSIGYTTGYAYDVELLDSAHVVVANSGKFSLFDVSDPNFPILLFEPHAPARAVALQDTVAFLACEQIGLMIMSLSTRNEPATWSTLRTPGNARDVAVQGDYAYIADGREGLAIVDISDQAAPRLVGSLPMPGGGYANKVAVHDSIAYIADGVAGLAVADVSDPATPILRSMIKTPEAKAVFVTEDGRIFATDRDWGLLAVAKEQP
jgi:hypothetical protein